MICSRVKCRCEWKVIGVEVVVRVGGKKQSSNVERVSGGVEARYQHICRNDDALLAPLFLY